MSGSASLGNLDLSHLEGLNPENAPPDAPDATEEETADQLDDAAKEARRRRGGGARGRAANILGGGKAASGFSLSRETLLGN